jgi:hypothetical protein
MQVLSSRSSGLRENLEIETQLLEILLDFEIK